MLLVGAGVAHRTGVERGQRLFGQVFALHERGRIFKSTLADSSGFFKISRTIAAI